MPSLFQYGRWGALYLYILQLDCVDLAWEYLRRNPDYRYEWQNLRPDASSPERWGLRYWQNPQLDARVAHPVWSTDPAKMTHVVAARSGPLFDIAAIPGHQQIVEDEQRLLLTARTNRNVFRMSIDKSLEASMPYGYFVFADERAPQALRAIEYQRRELQLECSASSVQTNSPTFNAIVHMRSLQAFDGATAGASQMEIAEVIFGVDTVAQRWSSDSDLRAQTRRLIGRAKRFVDGDYRHLLAKLNVPEQGRI